LVSLGIKLKKNNETNNSKKKRQLTVKKVKSWNEPSGSMLGNGFGWGQMAHPLAWLFRVTSLQPLTVSCVMSHCRETGADIHDR
jgi:hypothetical protein